MFLRGFELDGARISGRSTLGVSDSKRFFKLQKIRTGKNIVPEFLLIKNSKKYFFSGPRFSGAPIPGQTSSKKYLL